MSIHKTFLKNSSSKQEVEAELHDLLLLDDLFDAEEQWVLECLRILRRLMKGRIQASQRPESLHWNWGKKAIDLEFGNKLPSGKARLFGIRAAQQWQGLICAYSKGYTTRLRRPKRSLVYVDFIEVAPWNWDVEALKQAGKYRGIGKQLIIASIQWSIVLGYGGSIALHSLPQSRTFYSDRLRMTDLGPDVNYQNLCYLELPSTEALALPRDEL
jgi:hypothetical protein